MPIIVGSNIKKTIHSYDTSFPVIPMILTIPNFLAQSVKEQNYPVNGTNHTIYSLQVKCEE